MIDIDNFQISISEGNAIIQKYMGLPTTQTVVKFTGGTEEKEWVLRYHSDWNMLMNVGKKIREQIRNEQRPDCLKFWIVICSGLQNFEIEKTWKSFILYINYLNSQKN